MLADAVHALGASDDDPRLRSAEEFVAAETADIDAGGDGVSNRRLRDRATTRLRPACDPGCSGLRPCGGRAATAEVAASEVLGDGDIELLSNGDQIRERGPFGEALDPKIGRVDAEDHRGPIGDRRRIVCRARLVRRPDFSQCRTRLCHDIGHTETAADLDQLSA